MKKLLLLSLFIFNSFLFSDYLMIRTTKNDTYYSCITSYFFEGNTIKFKLSDNPRTFTSNLNSYKDPIVFKSGYEYKNNKCQLANKNTNDYEAIVSNGLNHTNLSTLGLSDEQLNFMFALSGVITSFIFLFGIFRWI